MASAKKKSVSRGQFCSAIGCTNSFYKEDCKGKSFFTFPRDERADMTTDWLKTCQAFGILGVLAMGAALACVLLVCFTQTALFLLLAIVATGAGGLFAMIEFAVYVGEGSADNLGYSFALTVVAFVLCLGAAGLFLVAHKTSRAA